VFGKVTYEPLQVVVDAPDQGPIEYVLDNGGTMDITFRSGIDWPHMPALLLKDLILLKWEHGTVTLTLPARSSNPTLLRWVADMVEYAQAQVADAPHR